MTTTTTPTTTVQTPAQWAVRWHGLVLCALVLGVVPLVHLGWHGVLGHDRPLVATRSQVPPPTLTAAAVLHEQPSWMDRKERQLREDSPVTWWLRGAWNETRYRLGVPRAAQVHFGADEWFFIQEAVTPDLARFERARSSRRRFLAEVRDLVRAAGAELFVTVLPDKARVHADRCWPGGAMPPARADLYPAILADLAAVDVPTVDLAAAMAAVRAAAPDLELYFRRDTHWRPQGARVAGEAVAAAIEQRFGDRLGPRREATLTGPASIRMVGDLVALASLLTFEVEDPVIRTRTVPMSFLSERLAEQRDYYGTVLRLGDTFVSADADPAAPVLLIGASFAHENGRTALAYHLGRAVRAYIRFGASGLAPLRDALPELRAGTRAKVVVWEVVERGLCTAEWEDPRL